MPAAPATLGNQKLVKHSVTVSGTETRNYSILYDPSRYASLWVAYPLTAGHLNGNSDAENWSQDPSVDNSLETNTWTGAYGVDIETPNYSNNYYSRGHQIPAGDRKVSDFRNQTFYSTNMTPQIQYGFNGGIWEQLETDIRNLASANDTLYIATGPVYQKKGGSETVKTITNARDGKTLPIANYYYKVVLKVKWSADKKTVTSAKAIGFWFEHKDYGSAKNYEAYTLSVNQIETWTGFDFFANLPDDIETAIEADTPTWSSFKTF